jgi:hypothetical protein
MSGGAGIGGARSRGPVYGDATVEPIMGASLRRSMRVTGGQIPEGPSSAPRRAPLTGMRPAKAAGPPTRFPMDCGYVSEAAV